MTSATSSGGGDAGLPMEIAVIDEVHAVIHVCQGPPRCDLEGDAAVAAAQAGCPFCKRIYLDEDGGERVVEPVIA